MMLNKKTALLAISLVLSGCSSKVPIETPEQRLIAYQAPISKHQIPKTELTGMEEEYQKAAESQFFQIEALARHRLADLALEESEDELLNDSMDDMDSTTRSSGYFRAITVYQQLLKDYPDRVENDGIRYQLARAYDYAGEPRVVLEVLTELVDQHPESSFFSEAQFRRGELLFTLGRFDDATVAYKEVTDRGATDPYFKHALYKQAWALYRSDRIDAAHHHFADLLEFLYTPGSMDDVAVANSELVRDVLRILAVSFSQMEGVESVEAFAQARNNQPYTALIYQALSDQLSMQRLYREAAGVYGFYLQRNANDAHAAGYHLKQIALLDRSGDFKEALQARQQFVENYGADSGILERHPVAVYKAIEPALQKNIIYLAKYYHGLYQKNNQLADVARAQYWYQYFLNSFPNDEKSSGVHFLYAESLYESAAFEQAAMAYESAAYEYPVHDKMAEAGYAALISHEKRQNIDEQPHLQQFIASINRFISHFPQDVRINEVRHKKADQHLASNEYAAAVDELNTLAHALPADSPQLGTVWYKLSYSHFMLDDYLAAEASSQQALLYVEKPQQRKEIKERLAAAIYKQGEQAQAAGDLMAAAGHFLRIVSAVPGAAIIAQAQYDAATALMSNGDWRAAVKVLERFRASYPRHKLVMGAREKLAYSYMEMGESVKAAHAYSALASVETDPERKRGWLSQAAELHLQEGNNRLAVNMLEQYLALTKVEDVSYFEVSMRIADIHHKLGNTRSYRSSLRSIVRKVGEDNPDIGLRQQAANASLKLADSYQKVFASIALENPIKKALKQKKEAMQAALDLYKQASQYRISNVTTASTYQIAEIYRLFSHALMTSEQPKELEGEEQEMYIMMLEEQAFPFDEKAIDLHKLNINRISSGLYDKWVKKSFQALGGLQPARFNKQENALDMITALN
ncbi:MAG: tetratricopeptide repeat protein [Gammaproteobacteria bacterium]|nr:tetratricopeptide repeat protein [Gammaproteobacteria bacterium]